MFDICKIVSYNDLYIQQHVLDIIIALNTYTSLMELSPCTNSSSMDMYQPNQSI